jgi:hypothetical protein
VSDADRLGQQVGDVVHYAIPEARAVTFGPRAMPITTE